MASERFVRQFAEDFVLELATHAGTKVSVEGGAKIALPSHELKSKWTRQFIKDIFERPPVDVPPPPPPPPPVLAKLELDTGYITFSGGVPVGGYSHLSLFPNGAFSFTGHFHVSGAPSYDTQMAWVIVSSTGTAFTFSHRGRVHGTFESGSRDDDWGDSGTNPALAASWADISAGYSYRWTAGVNLDLGALIDQAIKTIGQVATVVAIVA